MKTKLVLLCLFFILSTLLSAQNKFVIGADFLSSPRPDKVYDTLPVIDNTRWNLIQSLNLNFGSIAFSGRSPDRIDGIKTILDQSELRGIKLELNPLTYPVIGKALGNRSNLAPQRWMYQIEGNLDFATHEIGTDIPLDKINNEPEEHWKLVKNGFDNINCRYLMNNSSGIVATNLVQSELIPNTEQYHVKLKIMRNPSVTNIGHISVTLYYTDFESGVDFIKTGSINVASLTLNKWQEVEILSFNHTTALFNTDIIFDTSVLPIYDQPSRPLFKINNIKIEYNDGVDCYLDYLAIDNYASNELHNHNWDNLIRGGVYNYKDKSALWFYKLWDEPAPENLLPIRYTKRVIDDYLKLLDVSDQDCLTFNYLIEPQRFLAQTEMNIQRTDHYVFTDVIKTPTETGYTEQVQQLLAVYLTPRLYDCINGSIKFQKPFWFTPQAHKYALDNHRLREPSAYEIMVQTNLAIAYGAKGIEYFLFSRPWSNHSTDPIVLGEGFLDNDPDAPQKRLLDEYGFNKWDIVANLNNKLAAQGDMLVSLKWESSHYIPDGLPSGKYITNVTSSYIPYGTNLEPSPYIQLSFFNNQPQNFNKERFYVLNRRTLPDDQRSIYIEYDKSTSEFNNWTVREVSTNSYWSGSKLDSYTAFYQPAEGKLFTLEPTVNTGGELKQNEIITSNETLLNSLSIKSGANLIISSTAVYTIKKDITVEHGGFLTLAAGAKLNFLDGAKLIVNGTLQCPETGTSKAILDFQSEANNNGIVSTSSNFTLQNIKIMNATTGISYSSGAQSAGHPVLEPIPMISQCEFVNCQLGISISNKTEIMIKYNTLQGCKTGIYMSNVPNAFIITNSIIYNLHYPYEGILLNSSGGILRNNTISGYNDGICLGNSSPIIGDNTISDCLIHGIYVGAGSQPDLRGILVNATNCHHPGLYYYPTSGYNKIYDNGSYGIGTLDPSIDGSEIYLYHSNILMGDGCNSVYDNREGSHFRTQLLMSGEYDPIGSYYYEVDVRYNFWDNSPYYPDLADRFQGMTFKYDPYVISPCPLPDISIDCPQYILSADGSIIDTVYPSGTEDMFASPLNEKFAQADLLMKDRLFDQATAIYKEIIATYNNNPEAFTAYSKLLLIDVIKNSSTQAFDELRQYLNTSLEDITDDMVIDMLEHLINITYIYSEQYEQAIERFEEIIQQNPETEEALFAELDCLTVSLLAAPDTNTLGKTLGKKYLSVDQSDYNSKVNNIFSKRFGSKNAAATSVLIPKEYSLSQNYPNPFNPSTIIRYGIMEKSEVKLSVFDILGREIKVLVNEIKDPGFYQASFNGNGFASGVYFYTLNTKNFVKTNKMLLIK